MAEVTDSNHRRRVHTPASAIRPRQGATRDSSSPDCYMDTTTPGTYGSQRAKPDAVVGKTLLK